MIHQKESPQLAAGGGDNFAATFDVSHKQDAFKNFGKMQGNFPEIRQALDLPLCWTEFADLEAATGVTAHSGRWSDIVAAAQSPKLYRKKADMSLRKFASLGDIRTDTGCLRSDANIGLIYAVEIDYDGETVPLDDAEGMLKAAGIESLIHTTARHKPEAPRYRIIFPLRAPHPASEHGHLTALANAAIGGIAGTESFTLSQSFYVGAVAAIPYEARHISGQPLDDGPDVFLEPIYAQGKPARTQETTDTEEELPDYVTDETMRHLAAAVRALKTERAHMYVLWIAVLQHLKHLAWCGRMEEAEELAREFSQRSEKYKEAYFNKKWRTKLHPSHGHYKTLFVLAAEDGWINPMQGNPDVVDKGRIDMTDAGNVNALAEITAGNIRHVHGLNTWMQWDGFKWIVDTTGALANQDVLKVAERYLDTEKKLRQDAENATAAEDRKRLHKLADSYKTWANYCRSRRGIDAMLSLAARDQRFAVQLDALDRDRFLFGVANGVVDLRTGELRPAGRDNLITKHSPIAHHPGATAPRHLRFMAEICSEPIEDERTDGPIQYQERPDLVAYLQKALGYVLTGSVAEQKMFIASGPGANGKSVLFDMLEYILGPYAVRMPPEALMASARDGDAERPTPYARSVAGARLVVTSEAKEGQKLNAALVKRQTGDAKLTARGMRENAFTFEVTHKLWLLTNHHPKLDHSDDAIRSRLHIVPFDRIWNRPGSPIRNPRLADGDKNLMDQLRSEAEGILAWLVEGARRYVAEGLEPPPVVLASTADYLKDQDPLSSWLETMEVCEPKAGSSASDLLEDFLFVSKCNGFEQPTPNNATAFGKALTARNIPRARVSAGMVYGLKLPTRVAF